MGCCGSITDLISPHHIRAMSQLSMGDMTKDLDLEMDEDIISYLNTDLRKFLKNKEENLSFEHPFTKEWESYEANKWGKDSNRIVFGTAGLRGKMAPGYTCMNDLVVVQTSQGLCTYLEEVIPEACNRGVVIGFDARHNSQRFAALAAGVFLHRDFRVFLLSAPDYLPSTPMVPFGLIHLKAAAGIMITASHNPCDDNGYKVYWQNGAQIIPPHDKHIHQHTLDNLIPWARTFLPLSNTNPLLCNPLGNLLEVYLHRVHDECCFYEEENPKSQIKVVYTAMHGVGWKYCQRVFQAFGLRAFIPVLEQVEPNGDFPTAHAPNPENTAVLDLAVKVARENECQIILANDPDADRLAVCELSLETDKVKYFTGNETAALLGDWMWQMFRKRRPNVPPSKCFMVGSTVSSQFLRAMGEKEGFSYYDTLTGFKYIGNKALEREDLDEYLIFGFEMEIGFICGNITVDKDGIRTSGILAEMANNYYKNGETLESHLQQLKKKYGYFEMSNGHFYIDDQKIMEQLFIRIRTEGPNNSYIRQIGDYKISKIRDVTLGYDERQEDNSPVLPITPDSQMITFYLENGATATIRGSGTEPKVKYYVEAQSESQEKARDTSKKIADSIIEEYFQSKEIETKDWLSVLPGPTQSCLQLVYNPSISKISYSPVFLEEEGTDFLMT